MNPLYLHLGNVKRRSNQKVSQSTSRKLKEKTVKGKVKRSQSIIIIQLDIFPQKMNDSGGSSPFLESPALSPSKSNSSAEKERRLMSLQYKVNTLQNEFEIERLRMQQQYNSADKKYRESVNELEKALNDTKYLYENNGKLEKEIANLKEKLNKIEYSKEQEIQKLRSDLYVKEQECVDTKSAYDSKLSKAQNMFENCKVEAQGSQSLLKRYEEEISRQTQQIKELQMANSEKDDEVATLRASRVLMAHHNYSTEELQELTVTNKMLQDQLQYTKELEEVNLQQANELKKLRITNESQQFWKSENGKLQNKIEQMQMLENELQDSQLENVNLKSQLAAWELYSDSENKPEDIIRDWKLAKEECIVLSDENKKLHLDVNNLKILNDEMALERNQLLDLNKSYETSILNLKKLNHEIEQQKQLSFEECRLLRKQLDDVSLFNEEAGEGNKIKDAKDVQEFGALVDNYKNQTEDLTEELRKLNDELLSREPQFKKRKLSDQLGLNYSQRLNELQLQNVSLLRENQKFQSTNRLLEERLAKLTELKEKRIRILQLRDNPLLKDQFVKRKQLELLKNENDDLLRAIRSGNSPLIENIPLSVYKSLNFELNQRDEDLLKANKKFIRLKEIFNKKSLDFIDVINSLLGFKLEFQQEGKVKIFSCFKPERYLIADLNQNTLKSNLDSDMDDWHDLLHLWVEQRGQIPCFLATITLRLWEMSAIT